VANTRRLIAEALEIAETPAANPFAAA